MIFSLLLYRFESIVFRFELVTIDRRLSRYDNANPNATPESRYQGLHRINLWKHPNNISYGYYKSIGSTHFVFILPSDPGCTGFHAGLTNITSLDINFTGVSSAEFKSLETLTRLQHLSAAFNAQVDDAIAPSLRSTWNKLGIDREGNNLIQISLIYLSLGCFSVDELDVVGSLFHRVEKWSPWIVGLYA